MKIRWIKIYYRLQYQACIDNDPDCAVGECSHTVTSFKERVLNKGRNRVLKAITDKSSKAEQVRGDNN